MDVSSRIDGKVSVVIPAYKAAATIGKAVRSGLDDAAVGEIIVVLDGPDPALLHAVPKNDRVKTIERPSIAGAPAARNTGLAAAAAEFVMFLDADDYVEGGLIGAMARAGAARAADLMFGSFVFELPMGRRIAVDIASAVKRLDAMSVLREWVGGNFVPCCSVLWRTEFVRRIGGWDEAMLKNQDGELVWRACRSKPRIARASAGVGVYVQSDSGHRISEQVSEEICAQQIAVLADIEKNLPPEDFRAMTTEAGDRYHRLARIAYYNDYAAIGKVAEGAARRLGHRRQSGSIWHGMLARLVGLQRKERLLARLHRRRS